VNYKKISRRDLQWTQIVLEALIEAKLHPDKIINIQVGSPKSAEAVEQAIIALIADGNVEALRLNIELHTLN
jgi:DNA-binding TFAR19-related protein (PDSD5 family)|tara:strand:- start:682 stop:897 length:216 start_codon:yes stop_codon:yes gene_type:complete